MPTVDVLITSADRGEAAPADTLFATLYNELHRLARRELARQHGHAVLGVTTLLHEAYLAMSDREGAVLTLVPKRDSRREKNAAQTVGCS